MNILSIRVWYSQILSSLHSMRPRSVSGTACKLTVKCLSAYIRSIDFTSAHMRIEPSAVLFTEEDSQRNGDSDTCWLIAPTSLYMCCHISLISFTFSICCYIVTKHQLVLPHCGFLLSCRSCQQFYLSWTIIISPRPHPDRHTPGCLQSSRSIVAQPTKARRSAGKKHAPRSRPRG